MTAERADELPGDRVVLRPLDEADLADVVALARDPAVARWWPNVTAEALRDDPAVSLAVTLDDDVIGLAQHYEEDDPDYRHAGIDIFLGAPGRAAASGPTPF